MLADDGARRRESFITDMDIAGTERKLCDLHREELKAGSAGISYGFVMKNEDVAEAKRRLFPNACSRVLGGCMIEDETEAEVLYCDSCRRAETEWKDENQPGWDKTFSLF